MIVPSTGSGTGPLSSVAVPPAPSVPELVEGVEGAACVKTSCKHAAHQVGLQ
jgi:hypothetical protein